MSTDRIDNFLAMVYIILTSLAAIRILTEKRK